MKYTLSLLTTVLSIALIFQQVNGSQLCVWTKCTDKNSSEPHCYGGLQEASSSDEDCSAIGTTKYLCCKEPLKKDKPDDRCIWTGCQNSLTRNLKCLDPFGKEVLKDQKGCSESHAKYLCCQDDESNPAPPSPPFPAPTDKPDDRCIWTPCQNTLTRNLKCVDPFGKEVFSEQQDCSVSEARYFCCQDEESKPAPHPPQPPIDTPDDRCTWTDCRSTLTYEFKCTAPFSNEIFTEQKECSGSNAKYLCCRNYESAPAAPPPPPPAEKPDDRCMWTDCRNTQSYEFKCALPFPLEQFREQKECSELHAKYLCCKSPVTIFYPWHPYPSIIYKV